VRVTFTKVLDGRACRWVAIRPPRTIVPGPTMAAGQDIPHDLATFVVERELGLPFGFWGCVAAGATFDTTGRRRTPAGRAIIRRHSDELDVAERLVNEVHFAWRRGVETAHDEVLDRVLVRWRALVDGDELVMDWHVLPLLVARGCWSRRRG
jgi:hypothetical protein